MDSEHCSWFEEPRYISITVLLCLGDFLKRVNSKAQRLLYYHSTICSNFAIFRLELLRMSLKFDYSEQDSRNSKLIKNKISHLKNWVWTDDHSSTHKVPFYALLWLVPRLNLVVFLPWSRPGDAAKTTSFNYQLVHHLPNLLIHYQNTTCLTAPMSWNCYEFFR